MMVKEQTIFGITVNADIFPQNVNVQELMALLFASPNVTVEQVSRIISDPSNVRFDTLDTISRKRISELIDMQRNGIPDLIKTIFSDKIALWSKTFGVVSEDDIEYLNNRFHLNRDIFLQDVRKSLFNIIDTPKAMAEYVCRFIKGQNDPIKGISIPFYNHLLRVRNKINPPKSAVCLIGGTGVGKTETLKRFADIMNVPVIRINLGDVVPNGILGNTIAREISTHIHDMTDVEKYRYAVLHFSELDKLTKTFSNSLNYGIEIQKELLGFFDQDSSISLRRDKDRWDEKIIKLPVNDLLICFDGAFIGIEHVIARRLKKENSIRTRAEKEDLLRFLSNEDILSYGIIPELLSRIGKISVMNALTTDVLYNILACGKENEISVHKKYAEYRGFSLEFTDEALKKIATLAYDHHLGVRSIPSILNSLLEDVYFDQARYVGKSKSVTIDASFIEARLFYKEYGNIITDYEGGLDVDAISKKYGYTDNEIYNLIITHVQYKKEERK